MALILASKSPRRQELLAQMGLTDFEIHPAVGEELAEPGLTPPELVQALGAAQGAGGGGEIRAARAT